MRCDVWSVNPATIIYFTLDVMSGPGTTPLPPHPPIKKCQVSYNTVMNVGWRTTSSAHVAPPPPLRFLARGPPSSFGLTAADLQPAAIILSYWGQKIQFQTTMWSTGETKAECAAGEWRRCRLSDFQVLAAQSGSPPTPPPPRLMMQFYLFFFFQTKIIIFIGRK